MRSLFQLLTALCLFALGMWYVHRTIAEWLRVGM